ncbi:phosphotransferase family protein [Nocardia sp. NPDC004123]
MTMNDKPWFEQWITEHLPGLTPPVSMVRIGAGQSNITYLVTDALGRRCVLRRPPANRHDSAAHDVLREARVLRALDATEVPVPKVLGSAEATNVEGGSFPFYVMTAMPGRVLETVGDAATLTVSERGELSTQMIRVLAAIHLVDVEAAGLQDLGRRGDFISRQLKRGQRNWDYWGRTSDHDHSWEAVLARLQTGIPTQARTVLTHGDLRLANVLIDEGTVTAVLDWELCTLGDPLADLAWLLDDWRAADEPSIAIPSPTQAGGFADREALIQEYARLTGFDVSGMDYYRAFTHWKAATLLQGVLTRRREGVMGEHGSVDLNVLDSTIGFLLAEADELLETATERDGGPLSNHQSNRS